MMDKNTQHFYTEGANSKKLTCNPYCRKSQVLAFHAWQAGHYDVYFELADSLIEVNK